MGPAMKVLYSGMGSSGEPYPGTYCHLPSCSYSFNFHSPMKTLFLDTETTGLRGVYAGGTDEVIEVAILDNHGHPVMNTLVKPVRNESWLEAQRVHGISPAHVTTAPTMGKLLPAIREAVSGCLVVIYNAGFDLQFFPPETFSEARVECAMLKYAEWKGEWNDYFENYRWHKLRVAASATGFQGNVQWHRALGDTIATRHIWQHIHINGCPMGDLGNSSGETNGQRHDTHFYNP